MISPDLSDLQLPDDDEQCCVTCCRYFTPHPLDGMGECEDCADRPMPKRPTAKPRRRLHSVPDPP